MALVKNVNKQLSILLEFARFPFAGIFITRYDYFQIFILKINSLTFLF